MNNSLQIQQPKKPPFGGFDGIHVAQVRLGMYYCSCSWAKSIFVFVCGYINRRLFMNYENTVINCIISSDYDDDMLSMKSDHQQITEQKSHPRTNKTTQELAIELEAKDRTRKAKYSATQIRRYEYSRSKAQLVLLLIQSGAEYICSEPGCNECEYLTIDHKVPLSRGGGDEINNLQFMCKSHNSAKGDKFDEGGNV